MLAMKMIALVKLSQCPSSQCKEVAYTQEIRENHAKAKTPCVSFDYTIKQSFTAGEADDLMSKLVWPSALKFPHGLANGMTAPNPTSDDENDDAIDNDKFSHDNNS